MFNKKDYEKAHRNGIKLQTAMAKAMFESGYTTEEIAKEFHLSENTVIKRLKENDQNAQTTRRT